MYLLSFLSVTTKLHIMIDTLGELRGSFFPLISTVESITQNFKLVLVSKDHHMQVYFKHVSVELSGRTLDEDFFFLF